MSGLRNRALLLSEEAKSSARLANMTSWVVLTLLTLKTLLNIIYRARADGIPSILELKGELLSKSRNNLLRELKSNI
jgi:hypothetical protein